MKELEALVSMSKYAGGRYDLVQAGGGNSSVKRADGLMHVKASGCHLSEVEQGYGHVLVDNGKARRIFDNPGIKRAADRGERDRVYARLAKGCLAGGTGRQSIEMLLHALLYKYTLHTHPLSLAPVAVAKGWRRAAERLFPEAALVEYRTPGIEIALALKAGLNAYRAARGRLPNLVILQNHGIIASSDDYDEVIRVTEETAVSMENVTGLDLSRYRMTTPLARLVESVTGAGGLVAWLVCDEACRRMLKGSKKLFFRTPFCPDMQVYCGACAAQLKGADDAAAVRRHIAKYGEPPRVLILGEDIYMVARNVRKAREMEDVLKFHLMTLDHAVGRVNYLDMDEVAYIRDWDAEKYRKDR